MPKAIPPKQTIKQEDIDKFMAADERLKQIAVLFKAMNDKLDLIINILQK